MHIHLGRPFSYKQHHIWIHGGLRLMVKNEFFFKDFVTSPHNYPFVLK